MPRPWRLTLATGPDSAGDREQGGTAFGAGAGIVWRRGGLHQQRPGRVGDTQASGRIGPVDGNNFASPAKPPL